MNYDIMVIMVDHRFTAYRLQLASAKSTAKWGLFKTE